MESQGELKWELEAETTEKCWLIHSLSSFFLQPRTICLGMALPTVGWVLLHQDKPFTDMPTGQSDPTNPPTEAAFSYDSGLGQVDS